MQITLVTSGRSTTGYIFIVGDTTVSWVSQLQEIVALSTTEAENVAITEASKEMIWLQRLMEELGKKHNCNTLWSDSQSTVHLARIQHFMQEPSTFSLGIISYAVR